MLETKEEIEQWLNDMKIEKYVVNADLTVDVAGDVNIANKNLTEIPVQFGSVSGSFNCSYNSLTTLEGCPRGVEKHFFAQNNKLISTNGIPKRIRYSCFLSGNSITHIDYLPTYLGFDFELDDSEGMLSGLEHLYDEPDEPDNLKNLSISLKDLQIINFYLKIENNLESSNIVNKPRGKI